MLLRDGALILGKQESLVMEHELALCVRLPAARKVHLELACLAEWRIECAFLSCDRLVTIPQVC
jgi:hypothetical protein